MKSFAIFLTFSVLFQASLANCEESKKEELERKAAVAKAKAEELNAKSDKSFNDQPAWQTVTNRQNYYSFQRFLQACNYQFRVPEKTALFVTAGFPRSEFGFYRVIPPTDPNRPGIIAVSDESNFESVNDTIASIRRATSAILLARGMRKHYETRRASSILVARPDNKIDDGIKEANHRLSQLPYISAAKAMMSAEASNDLGSLERAASGGRGWRQFEGSLMNTQNEAYQSISQSAVDAQETVINRIKEFAFNKGADLEKRAEDVGKPIDLVAFEIDIYHYWPCGVYYFVKTAEGRTYFLYNVGKSYRDPDEDFLPRFVYASFNVSILTHYEETGKITEKDLFELGQRNFIFPVKEGGIFYISELWPESTRKKAKEELTKLYKTRGFLTIQDLHKWLK